MTPRLLLATCLLSSLVGGGTAAFVTVRLTSFSTGPSQRTNPGSGPNGSATGELTLVAESKDLNVLALQNTYTGQSSYSAVAFRRFDGTERGAVGYANPRSMEPYRDSVFIETSHWVGGPEDGHAPAPFRIIQTGVMGGTWARRTRLDMGTDGRIRFFALDGRPLLTIDGAAGTVEIDGRLVTHEISAQPPR